MTITLVPANSGKELDDFIDLPARLYSGFPEYTPPLRMDRESVLRPDKASFFKHGSACYWVAYRDGQAVGRISAQIDKAQPKGVFEDAGLFGCLDAIDDPDVTRPLFEAAETWLREQGRARAIGPFLLSINGEPGLLVEGRSEPPLLMVPWHPAYLEQHVLANGYARAHDLHYWRMEDLPARIAAFRSRPRFSDRIATLTLRKIDMKNIARDIEIMRQIYNDAWKKNWGFVPLEKEDLEAISTELKPFVKSEFGFIAELEGRPVAVAMFIPNLYEITKDIGPVPSFIGWMKLGIRMLFRRFQTGNVILFGLLSEYHQSIGGAVLSRSLLDEMLHRLSEYKEHTGWMEAGWVLEENIPIQGILQEYGFKKKRTLRLFDKSI
ncbi:hypothetical protein [Pararhodospirillum oryzae]|uniref:DNA-binding protein n=1 Tax=Pararhodospirillum oryzae TaxID=478448 RepID=A0A512HA83_9PROT|nr:hypothetical protein [Pararhodospirillum oryzae]GEO82300.1 DNA-binding protein [Pararhodospirillum oryzae]